MKRLAPHASNQLHLPLPTTHTSTVPPERQVELVRLLMELLITAIPPRAAIDSKRGRHAAEADR
jgi:hypothetical protein